MRTFVMLFYSRASFLRKSTYCAIMLTNKKLQLRLIDHSNPIVIIHYKKLSNSCIMFKTKVLTNK